MSQRKALFRQISIHRNQSVEFTMLWEKLQMFVFNLKRSRLKKTKQKKKKQKDKQATKKQ